MYVTASTDGSIKLWDGVSSRCVYTMEMAHDGMEVGSVTFSRNNKVSYPVGFNNNMHTCTVTNLFFVYSIFYHRGRTL